MCKFEETCGAPDFSYNIRVESHPILLSKKTSWQILTQRMKKGQPICGASFPVALGFEKLVSVFSITTCGYILSSAIGISEVMIDYAFSKLGQDVQKQLAETGAAEAASKALHN